MSQINISSLTFAYEGAYDNIFENTSFQIDTDWQLGFIGRNGRGKTTFLKLLLGEYKYQGEIISSVSFDYFPPKVDDMNKSTLDVIRDIIGNFNKMEKDIEHFSSFSDEKSMEAYAETLEQFIAIDGYIINELIQKELNKLDVSEDVLQRPFYTLSNGERTKCLLGALFLKKNNFLLIDEPTNHLDINGRQILSNYLKGKKSFILVSHDRHFLDNTIDHVLSINKANIEVQRGNYSTWKENYDRTTAFELAENEKLKKDVARLSASAKQAGAWSDKIEKSKIGTHAPDRGFIGHKAAKMMQRSKSIEARREKAVEEKSKLLRNVETTDELKLSPLSHHAKQFIEVKNLSLSYGEKEVISGLNFSLKPGERLALRGANGSGKTSLIKFLLGEEISSTGNVFIAKGITFSYVNQDTSALEGDLAEYAEKLNVDEFFIKSILRKMGFERVQFEKRLENYSEGQKKKVLLAGSLSQKAHVYIWDEPLNYVDIISRIQIENLLLAYEPTMIFVEHDMAFNQNIATNHIDL